MPIARIERTVNPVYPLRIWDDDEAKYGDGWQFYLDVEWLTDTHVKIRGLDNDEGRRQFTKDHAKAVKDELRRFGVTSYEFERYTSNGHRVVKGRV